jgi:hypothetical protein
MTFEYSWELLKAKKKKKKSKAGVRQVKLEGGGRGGAKVIPLNRYLTDMAKNIYLREVAPDLGPEIFKRPADVPPLKDGLDRSKPKNQTMIDRHSQATNEYERKMKNYRHFWDQVTKIRSGLRSKYEKNGHDAFMREFKGYAKPASEVGKLTGADSRAVKTGRMDALDRQLTSDQMAAERPNMPEMQNVLQNLGNFAPQTLQDINKKAAELLATLPENQRATESWGKIRNLLAEKYGFDVPEASPAANIAAANLARNPILPKPSEEKPPVMPPQGQMTLDQFAKPPTRKPPVRVSRAFQEKVKDPAQLAQEQSDRRFDERQAKTEQFFAPEPTPAPSDELTDEQRARIAQAYPDVKSLQPDMPDIFDAGGNLSQTMPEPSPSSQGAGSSEVIGNLFDQMMDNFRREQGAGQ